MSSNAVPQLIARSPTSAQLRQRQQQRERQRVAEEAYIKQQQTDEQTSPRIQKEITTTTTTTTTTITESTRGNTLSQVLHVGHHLRDIFVRPAGGRMNALDGYRAWLCLWMFAFHGIWFMGNFTDEHEFKVLGKHPSLAWTVLGFLPVDGFFILTGFLIAYPLFSAELKKPNSSFSLRDFWYRRMMRIAAFILFPNDVMYPRTLLFSAPMADFYEKAAPNDTMARPGAHLLPGSLVVINNLLPFGGYEGWTWSLAVQFQFYLWFPVIYGRARSASKTVRILWSIFVLAIIYRIYSFFHMRYFHQKEVNGLVLGFWYYSNTLTRMPAIIMGVLLAYYSLFTKFLSHLRSSRILRLCLSVFVIGIIVVDMIVIRRQQDGSVLVLPGSQSVVASQQMAPLAITSSNWKQHVAYFHYVIYNVFMDVGSPLSASFFAYIMIITINQIGKTGEVLNSIMEWSIWYPVSALSYWIYLLHPAIMIKVYSSIAASRQAPLVTDIIPTMIMIGQTFGLVFIIALICHILIEKPLDILLRSGSWPRLTRVVGWFCMGLCIVSVLAHVIISLVFSVLMPIDAPPAQQVVYAK